MFFKFASKEDLNSRPKDQPIRDPKSAKPSTASEYSDLVASSRPKPGTPKSSKPKPGPKSSKPKPGPKSSKPKPGPKSKEYVTEEEASDLDGEEEEYVKPEVVSLSSSNENSNGSSAVEDQKPKPGPKSSKPKPGPKSKKLVVTEEKASEHSDLDEEEVKEKPEVVSLASSNENSNGSCATIGSYQKIPEEEEDEVENENSD